VLLVIANLHTSLTKLLSLFFTRCKQHLPAIGAEALVLKYCFAVKSQLADCLTFVSCDWFNAADTVFGVELSKQFEPSNKTPAPRVLMRCTAELEKRIQETGEFCRLVDEEVGNFFVRQIINASQ